MAILYIKIVDNNPLLYEYYKNYKVKHEGDSGIDLITPKTFTIDPYKVDTLDFGIQCKIVKNDNSTSYLLYPRSSISNTPIMLANSVGVIDSNYRGNLLAKFRNFSLEKYEIKEGTRICQICLPSLKNINTIIIVDELDKTSRGSGGFGSTGI